MTEAFQVVEFQLVLIIMILAFFFFFLLIFEAVSEKTVCTRRIHVIGKEETNALSTTGSLIFEKMKQGSPS